MGEEQVEVGEMQIEDIPDMIEKLAAMGFGVKKVETNPKQIKGERERAKKSDSELRLSQLRVLAVLSDVEADSGATAITIEEMVKKAKVSLQTLRQGLGAINEEYRESHDRQFGFRSLLTRGLVQLIESEGENLYYLTQLGQRTCDDLEEEIRAVKATKPNSGGIEKRTALGKIKATKKATTKQRPKRIKKDVKIVEGSPDTLMETNDAVA